MKIKVWVYVWDTEDGTGCEVFASHKDAMLAIIGIARDGYTDGIYDERYEALDELMARIQAGQTDGIEFFDMVDGYTNTEAFSQSTDFFGLDTHVINGQEIELPDWVDKLLSEAYVGEFQSIDGITQHPEGLNFDQWLLARGYK